MNVTNGYGCTSDSLDSLQLWGIVQPEFVFQQVTQIWSSSECGLLFQEKFMRFDVGNEMVKVCLIRMKKKP